MSIARQIFQFAGASIAPIFSVWGQSNAEGGQVSSAGLPANWLGIQPGIKVANYGSVDQTHGVFNWQSANLSGSNENCASVYSNIYTGVVHSVEQAIAHRLAAYYNTVIYFDKLARGGLQISAWRSGGLWYDELLTVAADEKASMAVLGKLPVWLPVVWVQGESDAGSATGTAAYQAMLEALISQERSLSVVNRPWIFQLLSTYQTTYSAAQRATINQAFINIAAGTRAKCYTLDPSGYSLTMDSNAPTLHYSSAALVTLGHAHFDLMTANGLLP